MLHNCFLHPSLGLNAEAEMTEADLPHGPSHIYVTMHLSAFQSLDSESGSGLDYSNCLQLEHL